MISEGENVADHAKPGVVFKFCRARSGGTLMPGSFLSEELQQRLAGWLPGMKPVLLAQGEGRAPIKESFVPVSDSTPNLIFVFRTVAGDTIGTFVAPAIDWGVPQLIGDRAAASGWVADPSRSSFIFDVEQNRRWCLRTPTKAAWLDRSGIVVDVRSPGVEPYWAQWVHSLAEIAFGEQFGVTGHGMLWWRSLQRVGRGEETSYDPIEQTPLRELPSHPGAVGRGKTGPTPTDASGAYYVEIARWELWRAF